MQIILRGNLPGTLPRQYLLRPVIFGIHITTESGTEFEECTLQFYDALKQITPIERKFKRDRTQPVKNLFFDVDETEFKLPADTCRVVWPELSEEDEVLVIPLF